MLLISDGFHGKILTMIGIIYLVRCLITGKGYVGQTQRTLRQRWLQHLYATVHDSTFLLHRALRKYGVEAFALSVLEVCSSIIELNQAEQKYILELETYSPKGYNLTLGGAGTQGRCLSEETKAKISSSILGIHRSIETKARISAAKKGRPRCFILSSEAIERIAVSKRGIPRSTEVKERISVGLKGKHRSIESIEKTAIFHRGRKRSSKTCDKIRVGHFLRTVAWG